LDVEKVHTLRTMGKVRNGKFGKKIRLRDWKKVYVELGSEVDPFY